MAKQWHGGHPDSQEPNQTLQDSPFPWDKEGDFMVWESSSLPRTVFSGMSLFSVQTQSPGQS